MSTSLDDFRSDPKGFLKKTVVSISVPPSYGFGKNFFKWDNTLQDNKVYVKPQSWKQGMLFGAWTVPAMKEGDMEVKALPTPPPEGAQIMVTTQMTACSFVTIHTKDATKVGHASPADTTKGGPEKMQKVLKKEFGKKKVFGKEDYVGSKTQAANVIGIFNKDKWQIYSQAYGSGGKPVVKVLL